MITTVLRNVLPDAEKVSCHSRGRNKNVSLSLELQTDLVGKQAKKVG